MKNKALLSIADIHIVSNDPRILDVRVAERLRMAQPLNIRQTIEANRDELERYGEVFTRCVKTSPRGGRPTTEYHLNEAQTLLLCMFARTEQTRRLNDDEKGLHNIQTPGGMQEMTPGTVQHRFPEGLQHEKQ